MAIDDNISYELTGYQVKDLANKVRGKADSSSLASVATSGLYSDLTGKPTIPTVNNGTLTIQQNGTSVQTFTANQSTNTTANIETIYSVDVSSTQPVDWTTILNKFHPVGSIYMSATLSTAAQVEAAIGGTWVAWGSGRVPVGVDTNQTEFNSVEKIGGSKTHTHGLTDGYAKLILKGNGQVRYQERTVASWTDNYYVPSAGSGGGGSDSQGYATNLDGSTNAGSSLQPYITCYMYKRTA